MSDIKIVSRFKAAVQRACPGCEIVFFGSRVKGKHAKDSDYDVLVIVDVLDPEIRRKIYECAWEIGFAHDVLIAPVVCEKKEFKRYASSPFYQSIKKTGLHL